MGVFLSLVRALGGVTIPVVSSGGTPASGEVALYAKGDGKIYQKNSSGVEVALVNAGGGGITALDIYPVGSVYTSVVPTSPASFFGGTWVAFATGRTLVGIDASDTDFNTVEKTGGEKKHTLTKAEIPTHVHSMNHDHATISMGFQHLATTSTGGTSERVTDIKGTLGSSGATVTANLNIPSYSGDTGNASSDGLSGNAHNILQPYITVYMWKRTA